MGDVTDSEQLSAQKHTSGSLNHRMPTVLITGANRGIGLSFAKCYLARGWTVLATARDVNKDKDFVAVEAEKFNLDVTDDKSIAQLATRLKGRAIDLLINNSGIMVRDTFED